MEAVKEFFGFGGYNRPVEGFLSWQHILFVSVFFAIMLFLAFYIGKKNKKKDEASKNKVLVWTAIIINVVEIIRIIILCFRVNELTPFLYNFPLYLCSIQFITIPLAAFTKGRVKEASLDFVLIFGILGSIMGTYFAGNNYGSYPVLCFDNFFLNTTHCMSGFAAFYIVITNMESMKKKNLWISFSILGVFGVLAYISNIALGANYMFLMGGDGTPYDLVYYLLNGHKVFYPLSVMLLFVLYILVFYWVYYLIKNKKKKAN